MRMRSVPALFTLAAACPLAAPAAGQTFRTEDPVLRRMWTEGMEQSQTERLAQVLTDSIGPRRAGTPGYDAAVEWIEGVYEGWGIPVRREQYGTYPGWRHGAVHVDLIQPRVQTLEAHLLARSPGTDGPIEGEVVAIPGARLRRGRGTMAGKCARQDRPRLGTRTDMP